MKINLAVLDDIMLSLYSEPRGQLRWGQKAFDLLLQSGVDKGELFQFDEKNSLYELDDLGKVCYLLYSCTDLEAK